MRPAYIISAYKRPDLLFRLVTALDGAAISIHIDKKCGIMSEVESRAKEYPNVTLLPRHVCHWGFIGHAQASVEGLRWFITSNTDYVVLLTGQCYPIKANHVIESMIMNLDGRSLIEISPFPKAEWLRDDGGYRRLDRFYVKILGRICAIKLWTRRLPYNLHPYGGSGYWCLSREAAKYILDYLDSHPRLIQYCETVFIPDEILFHTILGNSPLRGSLIDGRMHYTDWSKRVANPTVLTMTELPVTLASDAWFARKFDTHETLDAIDMHLKHVHPAISIQTVE